MDHRSAWIGWKHSVKEHTNRITTTLMLINQWLQRKCPFEYGGNTVVIDKKTYIHFDMFNSLIWTLLKPIKFNVTLVYYGSELNLSTLMAIIWLQKLASMLQVRKTLLSLTFNNVLCMRLSNIATDSVTLLWQTLLRYSLATKNIK